MWITIIYIFAGLCIAYLTDKYIFSIIFKDNPKYIIYTIFHLSLILGCLSIFSYCARNLIQLIPFPLDNYYGFNYQKVKEVQSGSLINTSILLFSIALASKVSVVRSWCVENLDNLI
jgi:hypothetical protein